MQKHRSTIGRLQVGGGADVALARWEPLRAQECHCGRRARARRARFNSQLAWERFGGVYSHKYPTRRRGLRNLAHKILDGAIRVYRCTPPLKPVLNRSRSHLARSSSKVMASEFKNWSSFEKVYNLPSSRLVESVHQL